MIQLVLDRNLIRRGGLSDLANKPSIEFVLTDTFLVEMMKHPDKWDETVRRDFAMLAPLSTRLRFSLSVSEAMRVELREKRSITHDELLPPEFQSLVDELVIASTADDSSFASVRQRIAAVLPALRAEQPEAGLPKVRTEDLANKLRGLLRDQTLSGLRSGKLDGDAKLGLVADAALRAYNAYCDAQGEMVLPAPGSMVSRFYILKVWRAVWWLQHSGLAATDSAKLHNDSYDDEYILVGSFLDGVLSNERRVNEANAALRRILDCGSSDRLVAAFQDYVTRVSHGDEAQ